MIWNSFGLVGGLGDSKLQLVDVGKLNGWVLQLNFAGEIIHFLNLFVSLFIHLHLFICLFIDIFIFE